MCGRFTQRQTWTELVRRYRLTTHQPALNLEPRFNIAPTQDIAVIRGSADSGEHEVRMLRWGLVPFWAKDKSFAARMINARAETVHTLPAFRAAFRQRRCLIAADGFYEWQPTSGGSKQPYLIALADEAPFAFAGLWEAWTGPDAVRLESCTIIVTEANDFLRPVHDRMPVILTPERFADWLDPGRPLAESRALLQPFDGAMTRVPVSRRVNSVGNDDAGCIAPAGPEITLRPGAPGAAGPAAERS
jgi:putative SOS response-associated peptidase YedK